MNYLSIAKALSIDKDVNPSEELIKSAEFLGISARDVIIKARLVFVFLLFSLTFALFFLTRNLVSVAFSLGISFLVYYYLTENPKKKAYSERLKALNYAPEIVTVFGTSIELGRNLEDAVRLAADYCGGRISDDLANAYKDSILLGKPLIRSFTNLIREWGEFSDGFKKSMRLMLAGLRESDPEKTIELGMSTFLKSLSTDLKNFLGGIKTHTLILFSFGTIMPLIIISMMPVFNLLTLSTSPLQVGGLLLVNLFLLWAYSRYILNKRPPSFSQIAVSPGKGNVFLSILIFFTVSSLSLIHYLAPLIGAYFPLPSYYASIPLVAAFPVSLSAYFYLNSHSLLKKRNEALKAEKELLGITYSLGVSLQEKRSFEDALKQEALKEGIIPLHLRKALGAIKDLKVSPEKAIMEELSFVDSDRVKSVFGLIFQALRQGVSKGASGVFKVYEHFSQMIQVEDENKASLEQVLSMMKLTVVVFAPLISAFIVMMQQMINVNVSSAALTFVNLKGSITIDLMELLLGYYMAGLVIILTSYNVYLKNGPDKVFLYNELSVNLLLSLAIYIGTLLLAKAF